MITSKRLTATQKAATLAGTAAALSTTANGAVVLANGFGPGDIAPTTVGVFGDQVLSFMWDVDGDGSVDFQIRATSTTLGSGGGFFTSKGLNGGGMVNANGVKGSNNAQNLGVGAVVGTSLAAGYFWGFGQQGNRMMTVSASDVGADFDGGVFNSDQNYIGFRFNIDGATHYGWAQLELASQTLVNAAYNDAAGQAINVGQVPEASSIALLGLGVAGLGMMRRRKTIS